MWKRFVYENTPVYVHTQSAHWFVPSPKADEALRLGQEDDTLNALRARIGTPNPPVYAPKTDEKVALQEFWIHLTNRCNLTCTHCLFSSSPSEKDTLTLAKLLPLVEEAYALGARLFVLSGGEPTVHPEFCALVEAILAFKDAEVAVLTNGLLLEKTLTCKDYPKARVHFQVSLDGLPKAHEAIRGKGSFTKLERNLAWLKNAGYPYSLSLCLHPLNVHETPEVVRLAKSLGANHVHFMWPFSRGRAQQEPLMDEKVLFEALLRACAQAEKEGVIIDNLEALKTQIFAPAGTVHDGSSSGRTALAYDGSFYPSAAMVGEKALLMEGRSIAEALQSPVAKAIRESSVVNLTTPLRFLLGGGDFDHSFAHANTFMGDDPYERVMEKLALSLIVQAAKESPVEGVGLQLEMGEILYSCGANEGVVCVHSNCLVATGESASLRLVKDFYHDAALEDKEDILNPVCYEEQYLSHIPQSLRFRGYGCGSPVLDAALVPNEAMLDLGSGRGVECFIAAKLVGEGGRVRGVDMLDSMLDIASKGAREVAQQLGYDNLSFVKGYLESLPEPDQSYDVVTSNCVLNLSSHKRKLFGEIFRVLKNGGRLVVSDVVCDEEPSASIRNDSKLSGECIGGALTITHLLGLLRESGFENVRLLKRFFYRQVQGHSFYSLTFEAHKPQTSPLQTVMYQGPLARLVLEDGTVLLKGVKAQISSHHAKALETKLFIFDGSGNVANQEGQGCACAVPPEKPKPTALNLAPAKPAPSFSLAKKAANCMVCGEGLVYSQVSQENRCYYCGKTVQTSVTCKENHFVCDTCHAKEALEVIEHICAHSNETDMLALFETIRKHPSVPKHGPEHHAMVPAIIVTAFKNSGGNVAQDALHVAITRGASVMGGACGFLGVCGAASGVGIGFAIALGASPVKAQSRQLAQQATHAVLGEIATYEAARCCNREVWTALTIAAKLSEMFLHVKLEAAALSKCDQKKFNQYCYGKLCPIF